jgi:membrane protease YdiL (CAAX protease family)
MPPHTLPLHVVPWVILITVVFCATLGAMVGAWGWAIGQLRSGRPLLPASGPRPVPWGVGSVLVVFLLWLTVNLGVWVIFLRTSGHKDWKPTPAEQMVMVSLINLILLLDIPPILRVLSGGTLADLGISRRNLSRQALAGVVGFLLVTPLVYLLNFLAIQVWKQNKHPVEQMMLGEPTAGIACLAFLAAVVLAPAAEELIFRGVLQGWLTQLFRRKEVGIDRDLAGGLAPVLEVVNAEEPHSEGAPDLLTAVGAASMPSLEPESESESVPEALVRPPDPEGRPRWPESRARSTHARQASTAPIVITSALFAAVHLPQWPAPLAIFFLSMALGIIYQRTGSLFASFLMHALFNGISTMLLFQQMLIGHPVDPKTVPTATCSAVAGPVGTIRHAPAPGPTLRRP